MPNIYFEEINKNVCKFAKKPTPSILTKPSWFKQSEYFKKDDYGPVSGMNHRYNATIKNCPAVSDAINFGYILFTPVDIYVDATDEDKIHWHVPDIIHSVLSHDNAIKDLINYHPLWQLEKYKVPEGYHKIPIKINTFFGIKTEEGYSVWITHPVHDYDASPFFALSGIVDTDTYASRFPYAVFIKKGFRGIIHAGTPLIQVIPFKREEWKSHIVDLDLDSVDADSFSISSRFSNAYKKLFWHRKKFS